MVVILSTTSLRRLITSRLSGKARRTRSSGEVRPQVAEVLHPASCININVIGMYPRSISGFHPADLGVSFRLVRLSDDKTTDNTTVIFPESVASGNTKYIQATVPAGAVNQEIMDIGFTSAVNCDLYRGEAGEGCKEMQNDLRFVDAVQLTDHWKYKYLIDVDGMGYSAHFLAFMASQSAVLKSTVYREFFSDWIQPWYAQALYLR